MREEAANRETMGTTCTGQAGGSRAWRGHWVPFAVWAGVILLLQAAEAFWTLPRGIHPVSYAVKSLACAGLLLY